MRNEVTLIYADGKIETYHDAAHAFNELYHYRHQYGHDAAMIQSPETREIASFDWLQKCSHCGAQITQDAVVWALQDAAPTEKQLWDLHLKCASFSEEGCTGLHEENDVAHWEY